MAKTAFEIIRGSNMFVGEENTSLVFESARIPKPAESYEGFTPGGGNGAIDVATAREAIELSFTLKGMQPSILRGFNLPFGERLKFTWLGALVDEYATGAARVKTVMITAYGRLSIDAGEDKRDAIGGVEYTVKSINKYVAVIDQTDVWRFNIELGGWVMGGQSAQIAQAIGLNT